MIEEHESFRVYQQVPLCYFISQVPSKRNRLRQWWTLRPGGQSWGKQAPRTAVPWYIEADVDNLTQGVDPRTSQTNSVTRAYTAAAPL